MRSSNRFPRMASVAALALMGGLASVTFTPALALSSAPSSPSDSAQPAPASFSPGVREVLKMLDAKVDPAVIKAYIQNSNIPFNPTAAEIIALKQRDVPDDIITGMLQRGAEVRTQLAQAAQAATPVPAPATPQSQYGATAPYPYSYDYTGYGYPSYGYSYYGYPYAYGYPYSYWWYNSFYPWAFYSPFFFAGFHDFDHFHHFHDFDDFHGHGSFAFHGHPGFGNRGPWSPAVGGGFRNSFARGGFGGRSFASMGARSGGFGGHMGGFAARSGGGGFGGRGGGGHR